MSSSTYAAETPRRNIDFLGKRVYAIIFSLILTIGTIYVWIDRGPGKYGIDFMGGDAFVVKIHAPVDLGALSAALEKQGITGATVQSFEVGSDDYSIRVGLTEGTDSKQIRTKVETALKEQFSDKYEILSTDSVGATIGEEVRTNALLAILLGLVAIVLYVTIRFEFAFAIGALVSLFHDVIVALGVYLFAGHDLNSAALAAALTIIGYSVNDTIVIFDRVREEILKRRSFDLEQLLNESINFCMSRTIRTTASTILLVLALLVLGGGAIQDLALFLFVGMLCGVYSTIYIASPMVLLWDKISRGRLLAKTSA